MAFDEFYHEPKDKDREIVPVSINKKERIELDKLKEKVGIDNDSQVLKWGAIMGCNVLHTLLGDTLFIKKMMKKRDMKQK